MQVRAHDLHTLLRKQQMLKVIQPIGDRNSRRHAPTPIALFKCREQREQCFGMPPQAFHLAGLGEPLERLHARRFQQPVALHWIAFCHTAESARKRNQCAR